MIELILFYTCVIQLIVKRLVDMAIGNYYIL